MQILLYKYYALKIIFTSCKMVIDKFGSHVSKRMHNHFKKQILTHIKNKVPSIKNGILHVKGIRSTNIPTDENDLISVKHLKEYLQRVENKYIKKYEDNISQKFFVFDDKVDEKLSKLRSIVLINLILNLSGGVYIFENGNSKTAYKFPCSGKIKSMSYNVTDLLLETKINDKSVVSLIGQSVTSNDKLTFSTIQGQKTPKKVSVEILLEINEY